MVLGSDRVKVEGYFPSTRVNSTRPSGPLVMFIALTASYSSSFCGAGAALIDKHPVRKFGICCGPAFQDCVPYVFNAYAL
eukprot:IDg10913t1